MWDGDTVREIVAFAIGQFSRALQQDWNYREISIDFRKLRFNYLKQWPAFFFCFFYNDNVHCLYRRFIALIKATFQDVVCLADLRAISPEIANYRLTKDHQLPFKLKLKWNILPIVQVDTQKKCNSIFQISISNSIKEIKIIANYRLTKDHQLPFKLKLKFNFSNCNQ